MVSLNAIILGAGASGLMAAITAGQRGQRVLLIDHAKAVGRKLLVSGGGKCNITNRSITIADYFGEDPDFCRSALRHYRIENTLQMLKLANIVPEEREYGRIFCKTSARDVVVYLETTARNLGVQFLLNTSVLDIAHDGSVFKVHTEEATYHAPHLLIATGGLAWPQTGASDFGLRVAKQFGHKIIPVRPALTGFILPENSPLRKLQGINMLVETWLTDGKLRVTEPLVFTHKGVSGPAMFQLSCNWQKDDQVFINFMPGEDAAALMHEPQHGKLLVKNLFARFLPERLLSAVLPPELANSKVAVVGKKDRLSILNALQAYLFVPSGTEGFIKAETTRGGVATAQINPKTMESLLLKGLFFSGEVMDIAGKLGGYNIHWAFASGVAAGKNL